MRIRLTERINDRLNEALRAWIRAAVKFPENTHVPAVETRFGSRNGRPRLNEMEDDEHEKTDDARGEGDQSNRTVNGIVHEKRSNWWGTECRGIDHPGTSVGDGRSYRSATERNPAATNLRAAPAAQFPDGMGAACSVRRSRGPHDTGVCACRPGGSSVIRRRANAEWHRGRFG